MKAKLTLALSAAVSLDLVACATEATTEVSAIAPAATEAAIVADDPAPAIEPAAATADAIVERRSTPAGAPFCLLRAPSAHS